MTRHERLAALLILAAALWIAIAAAFAAGFATGTALAASRPAPIAAPPSGDGMTTERLVPLPSPDGSGQGEGPDDHPGPSATAAPVRPSPTPSPEPVPRAPARGPVLRGVASTYGPGWDGWLALPEGPGVRVRVCGAGGCVVRTSTDAGPSLAMQRAGRIVDLDVPTFEAVCGVPWTRGLCRVTVEYLR